MRTRASQSKSNAPQQILKLLKLSARAEGVEFQAVVTNDWRDSS